ncbi:Ubiquitin family protein [Cryptosporidium meleagridis]|uniref:Ubiquitin family protein n=1 Tax=Cryptosporidium meleagridis TaxID=93969 RepID=A0A2P4YX89_9CRYT|nr:Ubiquitin family protein [Cryptosporidium meleagridis]
MALIDEISIVFKVSGGTQFNITVPRNTIVKDLKDKISEPSNIPSSQQRLIYKGRILKDNDSLDGMKVESGHTMHLVKSGVQVENQKPTNILDQAADCNSSSGNSQTTNSNNAQNFNSIPPSSNDTNNGTNNNTNDPFAAMMNMLSGSDSGFQTQNLRNFSQNSYNGLGGIPNNNNFGNIPDLNSLMNSPIFQQSINELANNPQLVRNILHSNPMFAQLSANNPMLDQMLNNPEMMRMMLNPQMIQSVLNSNNMNNSANSNPFSSLNGGPNINQINGLLNDPSIASMLSGVANGVNRSTNSNAPNPAPQLYATQLSQLRDMGFIDTDASLSALQESGGDINAAINKLLERGVGQ